MRRRFWSMSLVSWLPAVGQLATLVVIAAVLLLPAPFIQNQLPAAVWERSDMMVSQWPTALLIQRTFAQEHRLPLWSPYFGGGLPLAGDPLAALFYPPTHLVHFLSLRDYFLVLMMGHLVFAGLGMLLLAHRTVGLSRLPALVAAVSYMATPRLIGHLGAGHVTIVQTVAWFPWLALACWATVREPRRWGAVLGICLALTLLAGHPQMAYYGLLMTAGMSVWLLVKRWWLAGWRALLMSAGGLAAAAVIGVLLAAVYLLPLMELTAFSTRQVSLKSRDAYPLPNFFHALIDQQFVQHSHQILTQLGKVSSILQLGKVSSIINTLIHQPPPPGVPWESMVTPGLVVLALALFAVVTYWRKAWPLALGVVLVTGLAMGNASPFYLLVLRILPCFDRFNGTNRIWFVALVIIAVLAGLGTESLLRGLSRVSPQGTVVAGFLTVLVVAFTLIVTDMGYARSNDVRVTTTPSLLARTAAQLAGSGRIYDVQRNIPQVSAVQLQARLADGWDPLLIKSYVSYMQSAGGYTSSGYHPQIPSYDSRWVQPNAVLLGLMHVSIVVSRRPLTDRHLVRVAKVDGTLIYKNTADAGPAYLVKPERNGHPPSLDTTRVRMLVQAPERDTFTFSTRTVEYLVIAMPAFPGWTAKLDGHPSPILLMGGALPAIKVGPGMHTLSYIYAPLSVPLGAMLSVVGLLVALAWFIAGRCFKPGKPHNLCP